MLISLAFLAAIGGLQPVRADEPMLAIRFVEDESAIYMVSEVQRIGFESDTLVVVTAGGSDHYAADSITRIEFLWGLAGMDDPRDAVSILKAVRLFQNQPNPFSPQTAIEFELPQAGHAELGIYGVDGRLIRVLVNDTRVAGRHSVTWDGRNDAGQKVRGGIYFYQLIAPGVEESRRMILLP